MFLYFLSFQVNHSQNAMESESVCQRLERVLTIFLVAIICAFGCGYVFYVWVILGHNIDDASSEFELELRIYFGFGSTIGVIVAPILCVVGCVYFICTIKLAIRLAARKRDGYTETLQNEMVHIA